MFQRRNFFFTIITILKCQILRKGQNANDFIQTTGIQFLIYNISCLNYVFEKTKRILRIWEISFPVLHFYCVLVFLSVLLVSDDGYFHTL